MVNKAVLEKRLTKLEQTLRKLKELSSISWDEYKKMKLCRTGLKETYNWQPKLVLILAAILLPTGNIAPQAAIAIYSMFYRKKGYCPRNWPKK